MSAQQLAMATLGTTGFIGWYATRGGPKEQKDAGPPINATSKDEESFIQYVYDHWPDEHGVRIPEKPGFAHE